MWLSDEQIDATLARLGLAVDSVFIPFSQSRNKAEKHKSLNWRVTLKRNGRDVLTCNYSAGFAHCPGYKAKTPAAFDRPARFWLSGVTDFETESGFAARFTTWGGFMADKSRPILPEPRDVIHSLVMDSDVLDAGGFDNWADQMGFDPDSRKAESTYRLCLENALAMRAALGESGMAELRAAFIDY